VEYLKYITVAIALLMILGFILGTIWVLFFAMTVGNIFALITILVVLFLLGINIHIYYKEEAEKDE
jgi:hypothetical protein